MIAKPSSVAACRNFSDGREASTTYCRLADFNALLVRSWVGGNVISSAGSKLAAAPSGSEHAYVTPAEVEAAPSEVASSACASSVQGGVSAAGRRLDAAWPRRGSRFDFQSRRTGPASPAVRRRRVADQSSATTPPRNVPVREQERRRPRCPSSKRFFVPFRVEVFDGDNRVLDHVLRLRGTRTC